MNSFNCEKKTNILDKIFNKINLEVKLFIYSP